MKDKVVEAYTGEYASGKSENAINRAVELAEKKEKVVLADLDLVDPFFTLRPIKKKLNNKYIDIISWNTGEVTGLGEVGTILKPELRWVLLKEKHIVLDIGYGVEGTKVLNLLEGIENTKVKKYVVINISKPTTSTVEDIVETLSGFGKIDGLINNTHLGDETNIEDIQKGAVIVSKAAEKLNLPVIYTAVVEGFQEKLGLKDICGNKIKYINRYMTHAYW